MTTESAQQQAALNEQPQKEHQWLQMLVGEWTVESEASMAPGQPPEKFSGTETVRSLGPLWIIAEADSAAAGGPGETIMTLGYDAQKKRYVGTFVAAMMTYLWQYEGALEGNTLSLNAEGPSMTGDGTMAQYKDVIEFKSDDHRVFTSHAKDADGSWKPFMTQTYRRKK